jgi:hypothetical protein
VPRGQSSDARHRTREHHEHDDESQRDTVAESPRPEAKSSIKHPHQQRIVIVNSIQDRELGKQGRCQTYLLLGAVDSVSSTE